MWFIGIYIRSQILIITDETNTNIDRIRGAKDKRQIQLLVYLNRLKLIFQISTKIESFRGAIVLEGQLQICERKDSLG